MTDLNNELPDCPICFTRSSKPLCEIDGYSVWCCSQCACDFVWPMPDAQSLKNLYNRKDWFEGGEKGGYQGYDEQTEEMPKYLVDAFNGFDGTQTGRSVLDIGCGYGTHLSNAEKRGWKCFGVELSDYARQVAQERHGESLYIVERIEDLPPHQFDLILMLDCLEHLKEPYQLFFSLFNKGAIGPHTKLVITTPNARSIEAITAPESWTYRHPPSHLLYFSANSLHCLLAHLRWNQVSVEGLHPLDGHERIEYADEKDELNKRIARFAGLLCTATGSDFTSFMHERYVPGTWNKIAEYEHISRYVLAQSLAKNGNVLDFGCGTGYGTAMLADAADSVLGLDISADALQWARQQHHCSGLRFEMRDDFGEGLPDKEFDLITCFEMIEHVDKETQERVIKSFRRLLQSSGKLVISTPNPEITQNYGDNPYHLHEMSESEFVERLSRYFDHVQIMKQWIRPSVMISQDPLFSKSEEVCACSVGVAGSPQELPAVAYIAVCSNDSFDDVKGVCNFDSSFDYVAKTIFELNRLNEIVCQKFSYFEKLQNCKKLLTDEHELQTFKQTKAYQLQKVLLQDLSAWKKINKISGLFWETILTHYFKPYFSPITDHLKMRLKLWGRQSGKNKPYQVKSVCSPSSNRPRVVHAVANFMIGGSSRLIVDLIEHLGHLYEQEVITSYKPYPPDYTGLTTRVFSHRKSSDKIVAYLKRFKPSLLHVHYWGECDKEWYAKVFAAGEKYGCKIVENINTPVEPIFSDSIERYVCVSDYVLKKFSRQDEKSIVIHPGSDFETFSRKEKREVPDNCIGMVYRLESDKLNSESINVFIEVVKRRPETKVLIVGGGSYLEPYKEAVRAERVFDNFIFTGYVPYDELPSFYEQMSIFVAPVWKESFGQVSPFAMNMEIPVVGYDIGALAEITNDQSLLAPPGDHQKLADIIVNLLENREKRFAIGQKNSDRAQSLFSVDKMINEYKSVYEDLMGVPQ